MDRNLVEAVSQLRGHCEATHKGLDGRLKGIEDRLKILESHNPNNRRQRIVYIGYGGGIVGAVVIIIEFIKALMT